MPNGFTKDSLCQTNLITFSFFLNRENVADLIYMDLSQTFDTVPERKLLAKLEMKRITMGIIR